jgi:hypothetical protein
VYDASQDAVNENVSGLQKGILVSDSKEVESNSPFFTTDFRFQKCQYKAYEAQESVSYYSLEAPKDGEVID